MFALSGQPRGVKSAVAEIIKAEHGRKAIERATTAGNTSSTASFILHATFEEVKTAVGLWTCEKLSEMFMLLQT